MNARAARSYSPISAFLSDRLPIVAAAIGLFLLLTLSGCAHHRIAHADPSGIDFPVNEKTALIVRAPAAPELLEVPGTGYLIEIGRGAVCGINEVGEMSHGDPFLLPAVLVIGSVGGAVYGVVTGDSDYFWDKAETTLRTFLLEAQLDQALAKETQAYALANGYDIQNLSGSIDLEQKAPLPVSRDTADGFWAILEIRDISIALIPAEVDVNPSRQFIIQAHVRLLRTADNQVLDERIVTDDLGPALPVVEWLEEHAKRFQEEIPVALQRLSQGIVEELFILQPHSTQTVNVNLTWNAQLAGLRTIFPPPHAPNEKIPVAASLQPTMIWQPLKAERVTYELGIWRALGVKRGELVYHREGLTEPQHTLEAPLEPYSNYLFSVRAHYAQSDRTKVSDWSGYTVRPTLLMTIASGGIIALVPTGKNDVAYQFTTPPPEDTDQKKGWRLFR